MEELTRYAEGIIDVTGFEINRIGYKKLTDEVYELQIAIIVADECKEFQTKIINIDIINDWLREPEHYESEEAYYKNAKEVNEEIIRLVIEANTEEILDFVGDLI